MIDCATPHGTGRLVLYGATGITRDNQRKRVSASGIKEMQYQEMQLVRTKKVEAWSLRSAHLNAS